MVFIGMNYKNFTMFTTLRVLKVCNLNLCCMVFTKTSIVDTPNSIRKKSKVTNGRLEQTLCFDLNFSFISSQLILVQTKTTEHEFTFNIVRVIRTFGQSRINTIDMRPITRNEKMIQTTKLKTLWSKVFQFHRSFALESVNHKSCKR